MAKWNKMNKTKAVLLHLQQFGTIDTWKANELYNATRLSAIIYNLRHNYNMNIISEETPFKDRYGTRSDYAKYILVKEDKDNE